MESAEISCFASNAPFVCWKEWNALISPLFRRPSRVISFWTSSSVILCLDNTYNSNRQALMLTQRMIRTNAIYGGSRNNGSTIAGWEGGGGGT